MNEFSSIACSYIVGWGRKRLFIAAVAATLIMACQKQDETAPTITSYTVNGISNPDTLELSVSELLHVQVTCEDDAELNQLRVTINPDSGDVLGQWQVLNVQLLSQSRQTVSVNMEIPDSIKGNWILGLQLADASGNLSDEIQTVLAIENSFIPQIELNAINGFSPNNFPSFPTGQQLIFDGIVTDDEGLSSISTMIFTADSIYTNEMWNLIDSPESWDMNQIDLMAPDTALSMTLRLEAKDVMGLRNVVEFPVEFVD